MDLRIQN